MLLVDHCLMKDFLGLMDYFRVKIEHSFASLMASEKKQKEAKSISLHNNKLLCSATVPEFKTRKKSQISSQWISFQCPALGFNPRTKTSRSKLITD